MLLREYQVRTGIGASGAVLVLLLQKGDVCENERLLRPHCSESAPRVRTWGRTLCSLHSMYAMNSEYCAVLQNDTIWALLVNLEIKLSCFEIVDCIVLPFFFENEI